MRIDIWSDVVCPWCYIGKRRLERVLAEFPHHDEVEVVYHSFQLDPTAPVEPVETAREMVVRRYRMTPEQAAEMQRHVASVAADEGMHWQHSEAPYANTRDAHRLLHLARELGRQADLKEALMNAYFAERRNLADHAELRKIAVGAGLEESRVEEVLTGTRFDDEVEDDIQQAAAYGATGVPFFVVDGRYGISGAQPEELFRDVIERAWGDSHPAIEVVAAAETCGPDGCAIRRGSRSTAWNAGRRGGGAGAMVG
jgi:predicted DsbA family dithiol-disulfide isomerase